MKELIIDTDHLRFAAKTWGDPNATPLLALHGWLDNAASFDLLAPLLRDHYCVAIDIVGHGHSDHLPQACAYHFIDTALYVTECLDALGWDSCQLLGHSMGGGIATLLAGAQPWRYSKIALLEGLGPLTADDESAAQQLATYLARSKKLKSKERPAYATQEEAAERRAKNGYLSIIEARILAERGTEKTDQGYVWRHDPKLTIPSPIRLNEAQVLAFLRNINSPVLVVTASNGFHVIDDKLKARLAALKDVKAIELNGGHHVHMEHPKAVADLLNAFLAG